MAQSICLATGSVLGIVTLIEEDVFGLSIINMPVDFNDLALYIISPITCVATQAYNAKHMISLLRRHVSSGWIGAVSEGRTMATALATDSFATQVCTLNILAGISVGVSLVVSRIEIG